MIFRALYRLYQRDYRQITRRNLEAYLLMEVPLSEYETQPCVPLPNTDLCITITLRYRDVNSEQMGKDAERILCLYTLVARGVLERDPVPQLVDTDSAEIPRRPDGA